MGSPNAQLLAALLERAMSRRIQSAEPTFAMTTTTASLRRHLRTWYLVTTFGGFSSGRRALIFVGDAWLALRLFGRHAVGLTYQLAGRSSDYLELPDRTQSRTTVGVYYTFLGSGGFGAVR